MKVRGLPASKALVLPNASLTAAKIVEARMQTPECDGTGVIRLAHLNRRERTGSNGDADCNSFRYRPQDLSRSSGKGHGGPVDRPNRRRFLARSSRSPANSAVGKSIASDHHCRLSRSFLP